MHCARALAHSRSSSTCSRTVACRACSICTAARSSTATSRARTCCSPTRPRSNSVRRRPARSPHLSSPPRPLHLQSHSKAFPFRSVPFRSVPLCVRSLCPQTLALASPRLTFAFAFDPSPELSSAHWRSHSHARLPPRDTRLAVHLTACLCLLAPLIATCQCERRALLASLPAALSPSIHFAITPQRDLSPTNQILCRQLLNTHKY